MLGRKQAKHEAKELCLERTLRGESRPTAKIHLTSLHFCTASLLKKKTGFSLADCYLKRADVQSNVGICDTREKKYGHHESNKNYTHRKDVGGCQGQRPFDTT